MVVDDHDFHLGHDGLRNIRSGRRLCIRWRARRSSVRARKGIRSYTDEVTELNRLNKLQALKEGERISDLRLMLEGEGEESAVAGEFELFANVTAMGFHRAMADEEFAADLLVGLVLGDEAEDRAFGGRERRQTFLLFLECRA